MIERINVCLLSFCLPFLQPRRSSLRKFRG